MDDREKTMKGLACCLSAKHPIPCHECDYYNNTDYNDVWSCRLSLMRDARELLKAQEPVKPVAKQEADEVTSDILNAAYCGKCGARIGRQKVNFCSNCGQEVNWDGWTAEPHRK